MRSSNVKYILLFATLSATAVSGLLLWQSWQMASTPRPTIEGLVSSPETVAPSGAHGVNERSPASHAGTGSSMVALDEVYVSLGATPKRSRSLVVNLELELFEERGRETVDKFRPAVRDLVLQVAMEQPYEALRTLPGKLSFKEVLVSRINKLVNLPIIRNVHFAAFYLQ